MDIDRLKEFCGEDWKRVNDRISNALKSDIVLLDSTNRMILSHSGKQLRPLLSLLVARACCDGPVPVESISVESAA